MRGLYLVPGGIGAGGPPPRLFDLRLTFDQIEGNAEFAWSDSVSRERVATGFVRLAGSGRLGWELDAGNGNETTETSCQHEAICEALERWLDRFPPDWTQFFVLWKKSQPGSAKSQWEQEPPFNLKTSPVPWIEEAMVVMAEALRLRASPLGRMMEQMDFESRATAEHRAQRLQRKEQQRREELARRQAAIARRTEERERRAGEARLVHLPQGWPRPRFSRHSRSRRKTGSAGGPQLSSHRRRTATPLSFNR